MTTLATVDAKLETLHVARFGAENFMRLRALNVEADGRHVVISGPNGSGKTSTLDIIWAALGGKPGKDMPEPIHAGADRAKVHLDLCDDEGEIKFTVGRVWTDKGTRLEVRAADGSKVAKPQELLDSFVDAVSMNPFGWLRNRGQDQVDDVLRVCGVAPPVEAVTAITGEHHPARDGESASQYLERLSADETGLYYVRRREANRVVITKDAALLEFRPALDQKVSDQETDISGLLAERQSLDQKREESRAVRLKASMATEECLSATGRLKERTAERDACLARVATLEKQLAEVKAQALDLAARVEKGTGIVEALKLEADAAKESAALLPDPTPRIVELDRAIQDADKNRQAIAKRKQARETAERLAEEAALAKTEHSRLDMVVGALRDERRNLLNNVDLGIRGLSVGDGELRLDGVSFKQASQAQKISVACAIAFRRSPRLKILRLDEAECLDQQSEALLLKLARENDWQCFLAFVRDQEDMRLEFVE